MTMANQAEKSTEQVKVEFEGGYFFLPTGMKRLHVYKEQIQPFLVKDRSYNSKWAKDRVSFIQKMIRAAGEIYEKLFSRLKHDVLNIVTYLTSKTGICNVTVDFMRETVQKRRARLESKKITSVKKPSESSIKTAYATLRKHTGQFVFARLSNGKAQSNVILDTKHPNFAKTMKKIWDIDVVFEDASSFLANDKLAPAPVETPEESYGYVPENVPAEISKPLDITEFEAHLQHPFLQSNVDNVSNAANVSKERTLTEENTVVNNKCQEKKEESVTEVSETEKPTVYQDEKLAGMINSFLYNNQMDMSNMQRLYEIAMEFKSKCIPFNIDGATIMYEINDALKYIRNANNVRGYFYSTLKNKFEALTTPQDIETECAVNVPGATENDSETPVENLNTPEWFKRGDHKKRHTSEPSETGKSEWAEKRKRINARLGLDENGELLQKSEDDQLLEKAIKNGAAVPQWMRDGIHKQHVKPEDIVISPELEAEKQELLKRIGY